MYIANRRRTNPIDFCEYWLHSFFYRSARRNSYALRPIELNSLKCSSIKMVHLIELKFGTYITSHSWTNPIDFGEYLMNSFFTGVQKRIIILRPMESNSLKYSSTQTMHLIELKFGMHIISHRPVYCIDFGEFKINSFFTGVQKRIIIHYSI